MATTKQLRYDRRLTIDRAGCVSIVIFGFKTVYDILVNIETTTEKRLLIDQQMMRETYEQRETMEVVWIPSKQNPANTMKMKNSSSAVNLLMTSNRLNLQQKSWVERDSTTISMRAEILKSEVKPLERGFNVSLHIHLKSGVRLAYSVMC